MTVIYLVKVEIDPAAENAWDDWNTRHHIPDVLTQPGFIKATKYRLETPPGARPEHWILYELASREVLEAYLAGDAVKRLRADQDTRFGNVTRLSRAILLPTASVEK